MKISIILAALFFCLIQTSRADSLPQETQGYKSWRAYPDRPLSERMSVLCSAPSDPITVAEQLGFDKNHTADKGLHKDKFLSVYINPTAETVLEQARRKNFPIGSAIVKEKKPTKLGAPRELGIMIKRPAGFDLEMGDWEYFFMNKDKKLLPGRAACGGCHQQAKETDYVFGNYSN